MKGQAIDLEALAAQAGVTPEQAEALVSALVEQVLRGAGTGIEIPGLGRIEQESAAGLGAPLRMVFSPNARMAAARYTRGEAPPQAEPAPEAPPPPPEEPDAPVAPPPPATAVGAAATISGAEEDEGVIYISFRCAQCGQEIEASTELAGATAACPQCAQTVRIPDAATIQTYLRQAELRANPAPAQPDDGAESPKSSTVRIDLPNDAPYTHPVRRTIQIKRRT